MAIRADELRQCQARLGRNMSLRCQDKVTEVSVHAGLHWAVDRDGQRVRWHEGEAMYPAIDGNFRPFVEPLEVGKKVVTSEIKDSRFETKDSGVRAEYDSGMVRDTQEGKARFELMFPLGVPYKDQFLTRFAELLARGAEKYEPRNWEKATGEEEMERFKSSAIRHLMQWAAGEDDEDHAAAVVFNLLGYETTKWKRDAQA